MTKKPQIEYYQNLLKNDNEVLLLKSQNSFYKTHYKGSPLNVITGFEGTAGEAVLEKSGKVTLFVDTRYHKLVDKQAFSDILIYKMPFGETYMQAFKKQFPKATKFYLPSDIKFLDYLAFEKHFEVELYKVEDVFLKNDDINSNSSIFKVDLKRSFQEKIKDVKFARFLVMDLDIISYFVNLRSFRMKYSSNFEAYLYIDKINEKYVLFADNAPQVENLEIKPIAEFENYISTIQDDIYVDFSDISCEILKSIQNPQKMPDNSLNVLASIKTEDEIDVIKKAFSLLDCSILELKNKVKQGMSEFDLVNLFEDELFKKGFSALSFKTILSIDENTASIHYSSYDKNKLLNPESLYLLDCGGYLKEGYATDITRTFYFGKNPNPLYKKIYTAVLKAFIECFLSKEKQAALLNNVASNSLAIYQNEGFYFNHGLGHGIGTSCHQNPPLVSGLSKNEIYPYQTHSIEPGLYGKSSSGLEFGVRIENCVYFDKNYIRHSLSKFPFEDILINYDDLDEKERTFVQEWQANFG